MSSKKNVYIDMGKSVFSDECYTSKCESDKIVDFLIYNGILKNEMILWLPFDSVLSNIYKSLKEKFGGEILLSNLEVGLDFYNYEPKEYDLIFTNPPFKNRTRLFKRLHYLGKPFIILQPVQMFNNKCSVNFLCDYSDKYQFILPKSRMNFLTYNKEENIIKSSKNGILFYSFWLCYGLSLKYTFNALLDTGKEKEIEKYDQQGNIIVDNQRNLFTDFEM